MYDLISGLPGKAKFGAVIVILLGLVFGGGWGVKSYAEGAQADAIEQSVERSSEKSAPKFEQVMGKLNTCEALLEALKAEVAYVRQRLDAQTDAARAPPGEQASK